jgi:Flp pilus assembly protein CpaB
VRDLWVRRVWLRHGWRLTPLRFWVPVGVVALVVASTVTARVGDASAERAAWGTAVRVVVAAVDLPAGTAVTPDVVTVVDWPAALAPATALGAVPAGSVLAADVAAGEAITSTRLAAGGSPLAAVIAPDRRAVAVPVEPGSLAVAAGDLVDLVAPPPAPWDDAGLSDRGGGSADVVAAGATVVDVGEAHLTVAVTVGELGPVAAALANGPVIVAVIGAPPAEPSTPP